LQDEDVEKMYESYLKEIRDKQNETKVKREVSPIPYSRNPASTDRKLNTLRSTTPPPRNEVNSKRKKMGAKKLIIPILFIVILAIAASYLMENPTIEESISSRYQISAVNSNAVESTVTDFLEAVNDGDYNTAFNMYQGKDFLAVASIEMIFGSKGIDPGNIKHIDITSTQISDDIAVVNTICTVSNTGISGNELSTSTIPIYFQLQNSDLGWIITGVSFKQPFDIESEEIQAISTGKQATQEVSSNLMVKTIEGVRAKNSANDMSGTIDLLILKVGLNAGSSPVDINQVVIAITDGTTANNLVYAGNQKSYASAGNSDGYMDSFSSSASINLATLLTGTTTTSSTSFQNSNHYYTVEKIRDEDSSFSQSNPVMNTGDLITLYIATTSAASQGTSYGTVGDISVSSLTSSGLTLVPRTTVNIVLTPESGAATTADFVLPSSYGVTETVQLYP
jgi:flagellin FlaB